MLSKIERCVNLDIKVRIKIRKRDKGREKMGGEKENIGTYSLAISRKLESSKLDSTDPRGRDTTFFETSRVIYESFKSRLKCVIYEFPSSMAASEKYELYSKPICVQIWLLTRKFARKRIHFTYVAPCIFI